MTKLEQADKHTPFDDILADYIVRIDRGEAVDRDAYIIRHPAHAEQLRVYFRDSDAVGHMIDSVCVSNDVTAEATDDITSAAKKHRIGDYVLQEEIGSGGMGVVYQAYHTRLKKRVALKVLAQDRITDPLVVARFEREMAAAGRIDHPNVARATDAGEFEGNPYLVMEYIEGVDLGTLVKQFRSLAVADACELIRQAAVGLQVVHKHNLVHRDIKPSNLMLTNTGQVKILDMGLARLGADEILNRELTTTGQILGTVDYMAPEQASDIRSVDIRTDIYSLGCSLYRLLAGQNPFSGPQYPNPLSKALAHAHDSVPSIRKFVPAVPKQLAIVLEKMLAKKPKDRFATPDEVVEALAPFAEGSDLQRLAARASGEIGKDQDESAHLTDKSFSLPTEDTLPAGEVKIAKPQPAGGFGNRRVRIASAVFPAFIGLVIALGVFYVATDKGTLEIKTHDPDVEVIVLNGDKQVKIVDRKTGNHVKLRSGNYELELSGGEKGLRLSTDHFQLRRGEKVIVEVFPAVLPAENAVKPDAEVIAKPAAKPVAKLEHPLPAPTSVSRPKEGEPVNLRELNTPEMDFCPTQSKDPCELIFSRGAAWELTDLMVTRRSSVDTPWGPPVPIRELNSTVEDFCPTIRFDGLEIIFTSGRRGGKGGGGDLWRATRPSVAANWSKPKFMSELSSNRKDWFPSLSRDGLELYFCSNRPAPSGGGRFDLYVTRRKDLNSPFGPVEFLSEFNSSEIERSPCLSSDQLTFYFISNHDDFNLWYATRETANSAWSIPARVPGIINKMGYTYGFFEPQDGKTCYFDSSNLEGAGSNDLWAIHPWQRPPRLNAIAATPTMAGKPVNLRELNTPGMDSCPTQSNNPCELIFTSGVTSRGNDLMIARRSTVDAPWGAPVAIRELNSTVVDLHPTIRFDGLEIIFTSGRPGGKGEGDDLWRATRPSVAATWSKPKCMSELSSHYKEWFPSLSRDGLELYFSSNRPVPSGGGRFDLYVARRKDIDSPFGRPQFLSEFNSSEIERSSCISTDQLTIYFGSDRSGKGNMDIWYATRETPNSPWSAPARVPGSINTTGYEQCPFETQDGQTFYLESSRPGGAGGYDLWAVHPWQRPPRLTARAATPTTVGKPKEGEPVNLSELNTTGMDFCPTQSNDPCELIFSRGAAWEETDLMVTRRSSIDAPWGPAVPIRELNSTVEDYSPTIRFDGLEIVFCSGRPGGKDGGGDLWRATRPSVAANWSKPKFMSELSSNRKDWFPSLSRDGLVLYFISDRPAPSGGGRDDLYMARRKDLDSPFGPAIFMAEFNSSNRELSPCLSTDQLTFYFASDRGGKGDMDIWYATRKTPSSPWSAPARVPGSINTTGFEHCPFESQDGQTFYFESSRPGGAGSHDLWAIHPWQRPPRLSDVKNNSSSR